MCSRLKRQRELTKLINRVYLDSRRIYGSPRIHAALVHEGVDVCVNTVAKLMRKNGIYSKVFRRFVVTTNSRHNLPAARNLLKREFTASHPIQKWVSDVSFISTREGFVYLATIMDLYSRKVIGWSMSNKHNTQLISDALEMAVARRGKIENVVLHSDRGNIYASREYQRQLQNYGIIASMSRKGDCWDNAPMESFFHSLKTECVNFERYQTRSQARRSLFDYIEVFYNRKRLHSTINYMTPTAYEAAGVH